VGQVTTAIVDENLEDGDSGVNAVLTWSEALIPFVGPITVTAGLADNGLDPAQHGIDIGGNGFSDATVADVLATFPNATVANEGTDLLAGTVELTYTLDGPTPADPDFLAPITGVSTLRANALAAADLSSNVNVAQVTPFTAP
jgi:hypothetical protein